MKTILKEEQLSQEFIQSLDNLNQSNQEYLVIELHGKKFIVIKEEANTDRGDFAEHHDKHLYAEAKKRAITDLKTGFHMGGKIMVSREELHER